MTHALTREQLWSRLEAVDYFDWCEEAEHAALRALFFDGVLWPPGPAPTWMACRELFFHPQQTPAQWACTVELRSRYVDDEDVVHTSPRLADEYRAEALSMLLASDHLYSGMGVPEQLALLDWLGWMDAPPSAAALDAWMYGINGWIEAKPREPWLLADADDSRHAHALPWLYCTLDASPLVMQGRWMASTQDGWCYERFPRNFLGSLQSLMRMAEKGKVPHRPGTDPGLRQDFLRQLRDDLVADAVPALLQQVWAMTRKP